MFLIPTSFFYPRNLTLLFGAIALALLAVAGYTSNEAFSTFTAPWQSPQMGITVAMLFVVMVLVLPLLLILLTPYHRYPRLGIGFLAMTGVMAVLVTLHVTGKLALDYTWPFIALAGFFYTVFGVAALLTAPHR